MEAPAAENGPPDGSAQFNVSIHINIQIKISSSAMLAAHITPKLTHRRAQWLLGGCYAPESLLGAAMWRVMSSGGGGGQVKVHRSGLPELADGQQPVSS